jgi:hypothetical protein
MFFTAIYVSSFLILRAILGIIGVGTLSAPYLPPTYALGVSLLLVSIVLSDLNSIVV